MYAAMTSHAEQLREYIQLLSYFISIQTVRFFLDLALFWVVLSLTQLHHSAMLLEFASSEIILDWCVPIVSYDVSAFVKYVTTRILTTILSDTVRWEAFGSPRANVSFP